MAVALGESVCKVPCPLLWTSTEVCYLLDIVLPPGRMLTAWGDSWSSARLLPLWGRLVLRFTRPPSAVNYCVVHVAGSKDLTISTFLDLVFRFRISRGVYDAMVLTMEKWQWFEEWMEFQWKIWKWGNKRELYFVCMKRKALVYRTLFQMVTFVMMYIV